MVQLSHPHMITGKTIALTRRTFVGKVMSLLFNMLSRLVITFLPRSKRVLISWLQSQSAVILEPPKIKSDTVSTVSPSISHEVMGPDAVIASLSQFLQNGLVGSPCSPRESQESSPAPQFKSINSLVLSPLHSPTFTSIHDHWKNHCLD